MLADKSIQRNRCYIEFGPYFKVGVREESRRWMSGKYILKPAPKLGAGGYWRVRRPLKDDRENRIFVIP